jgi:hypothetical protein
MRTRTRSNRLIIATTDSINQFSEKYYSEPSHTLQNTYYLPSGVTPPVVMFGDSETIHDDPSKGRHAKEVLHTKRIISRNSYPVEKYGNATQSFECTEAPGLKGSAHWRAWSNYGDVYPENIQVNWDVPDETLIRQCLGDFNQLNDVNSLLNAVEAPQFTSGLKSLYDNVNAPVYKGSMSPKLAMRSLKTTKLLTGGYLYYQFGIAPVIADMRKLSKATTTYSRQLKKAISTAGTAVSVHRTIKGTFGPNLVPGTLGLPYGYGSPLSNGTFWSASINHLELPTKIVTIRGVRVRKYETEWFQKLDYLASRFGSTGPASFAWERIPFSFVADWFLDTSAVLGAMDNFLTGSSKNILDATLSTKWSCLAGAVKHKYNNTVYSTLDGQQTAQTELSYYHRKPIQPTVSVGLNRRFGKNKALSGGQLSLAAALVGQLSASLASKCR